MSATTHPRPTKHDRAAEKAAAQAAAAAAAVTRRRRQRIAGIAAAILVIALVAYGLLTSQAQSSTEARPAPDFTLPTTDGGTVTLSDLRGSPVV
ncbi:MAG: peroxiredoxin family protein, partial [Actinomycetota bacterium]